MTEIKQTIIDYLVTLYGAQKARMYFEYICQEPERYIRLNQFSNNEDLFNNLNEYGISAEKVNEIPNAYRLSNGKEISGKTLETNIGKYYIQSLSSMIPPIVLNPAKEDVVLDLCAAPGSKTTQIAEMMNNEGRLFSNEISLDRLKMLVHNIDRMNIVNTGVMQLRGEFLDNHFTNYFDKILVDAPCSALGVIQKQTDVGSWWSHERVEGLTFVQTKLITSAIKMLKVGGELVYSTCTLTPEENEMIIDHVIKKYPMEVMEIELPVRSVEGHTRYRFHNLSSELTKTRRILPWEIRSEGFFIAKLRKTAEIDSDRNLKTPEVVSKLLSYKSKELNTGLKKISERFYIPEDVWENYKFIIKGNDVFFADAEWDAYYNVFTRFGTRFGLFDKKGNLHLHTIAAQVLQKHISKNIFTLEDKKQLSTYINGGILRLPGEFKEQQIIKYKSYFLGTAVPVEGGLKSQYPKAMRMQEMLL